MADEKTKQESQTEVNPTWQISTADIRWYQYIDCEAGMVTSLTINKIGEALAKAQGEIKNATKASDNPYYSTTYADLASVWDACREPLTKNGLSVVQGGGASVEGKVVVTTLLIHSSGEWIKSSFSAVPTKIGKDNARIMVTDPQGVGSCITYLRRYGLQAMVGIAPADDDGNAASGLDNKLPTKPPIKKPMGAKKIDVPPLPDKPISPTTVINKKFMAQLEEHFKEQKYEDGFVYSRAAMKEAVYEVLGERWPNNLEDVDIAKSKIDLANICVWGA